MIITATICRAEFYLGGRYVIAITYRLDGDIDCAGSFDYTLTYNSESAAREAAEALNLPALVAAHLAAEAARILGTVRHTTGAKVVIA